MSAKVLDLILQVVLIQSLFLSQHLFFHRNKIKENSCLWTTTQTNPGNAYSLDLRFGLAY